jgi:hypothetical protein
MTPNAGSTKSGTPYIMKYTDDFRNLCSREVDHPSVISHFFGDYNTIIDSHNQARQANAALEKTWLTMDPWFRLTTTLIGINVTDAWKLASFHGIINFSKKDPEKMITITRFAGVLGWQLIHNASTLTQSASISRFACFNTSDVNCPLVSVSIPPNSKCSSLSCSDVPDDIVPICSIADANGLMHLMVKLPLKKDSGGHNRTLARMCKLCKAKNIPHDIIFYCYTCGLSANYCSPDDKHDQDCFLLHVKAIKRSHGRRGEATGGDHFS